MSKAELKDIKSIEVQFTQTAGKRESIKIQLNGLMFRGDALKVADAISLNPDVATVRCFTVSGRFI